MALKRIIYSVVALMILATLGACTSAAQAPTATPTKSAAAVSTPAQQPTSVPTKPSAVGSATAPAAASSSATLDNVKYGYIQSYSDAAVFMAMEKGFFKEQNIDPELVNFSANDQMVAPLGTGELDVGNLQVTPAGLNAKDRGIDIRFVADKSTSQPGYDSYWILLRKDLADSGQVKTPADLKGKKLAVMAKGGLGQQIAELLITKGNLTQKDLADGDFQVLALNNHIAALSNKAIDASLSIEPTVSAAIQQGVATKWIAASSLFPNSRFEQSLITYSPKMVKNTDLGRRWMVAYIKGVRYYLDALKTPQGKSEIAAAVSKYTAIKDPKAFDAMEPPYFDPNGAMEMTSLNSLNDWLVKSGVYQGKTTLKDLIDTSFIDYAVQKLGKY